MTFFLIDYFAAGALLLLVAGVSRKRIAEPTRRLAMGRAVLLLLLTMALLFCLPHRSKFSLLQTRKSSDVDAAVDLPVTSETPLENKDKTVSVERGNHFEPNPDDHASREMRIAVETSALENRPSRERTMPTAPDTPGATNAETDQPAIVAVDDIAHVTNDHADASSEPSTSLANRRTFVADTWKWATMAYLCGAAALAGWFLVGAAHLRRLLRRSEDVPRELPRWFACISRSARKVNIRFSREITAPIVTGTFWPTIVLPKFLWDERRLDGGKSLQFALAHEWAHIKNGDLRFLALYRLAALLLFPNPLFWRLGRRLREDQELLADAHAAALTLNRDADENANVDEIEERENRRLYALELVRWSRRSQARPSTIHAASSTLAIWEMRTRNVKSQNHDTLTRRIDMLLEEKRLELTASRRWKLLTLLLTGALVLALSLFTFQPRQIVVAQPTQTQAEANMTEFMESSTLEQENPRVLRLIPVLSEIPLIGSLFQYWYTPTNYSNETATTQTQAEANVMEPAESQEETVSGTMTLTVLDENGKPIADATGYSSRVDRDQKRPYIPFTTDENGEAVIEVPEKSNIGWMCIAIKTNGYTPFFGVWDCWNTMDYPESQMTVELGPARTVGGIVHDPDGNPVTGVSVEFSFPYGKYNRNDSSTYCAASGKTDSEGRWSCAYVPLSVIGPMRFDLRHADFRPTQVEVDPAELAPDADGRTTHVMTLERGLKLGGTIRDESGEPIVGAKVEVQFFGITGGEQEMYRRTSTDAKGEYLFDTCPPVEWAVVVASASGFAGRYAETSVSTDSKPVDLELAPSKALKLRFVDRDGNPVPKVFVSVDEWGPFPSGGFSWIKDRMLKTDNYTPFDLCDGNGYWVWNDAVSGPFKVAVSADGSMSQDGIDVEAGQPEKTVTLLPELAVTGKVIDGVTGEPIPSFRVIEGIIFSDPSLPNSLKQDVNWQTHRPRTEKDGVFLHRFLEPHAERRLRVEAEGYEACDSRAIGNDEGAIELEFRLVRISEEELAKLQQPKPLRTGRIVTPDGEPAADARVVYATSGQGSIGISLPLAEGFDYRMVRSDTDGRFTLMDMEFNAEAGERYAFIVAHESGFVRIEQDEFESLYNTATDPDAAAIRLEPWAEVNGTLMVGAKPGQGMALNLDMRDDIARDGNDMRPQISYHYTNTKTDENGRFTCTHVAPGNYSLTRMKYFPTGNGSSMGFSLNGILLSVATGETKTVVLGGVGRPVIGKVELSAELENMLETGRHLVRIHNRMALPFVV